MFAERHVARGGDAAPPASESPVLPARSSELKPRCFQEELWKPVVVCSGSHFGSGRLLSVSDPPLQKEGLLP